MTDLWKTILALAVLFAPVAYCEAESAKAQADREAREIEACVKSGGAWSNSWRGSCSFGTSQ
jgi:hypothetical protein